jgi:hypothetical protein
LTSSGRAGGVCTGSAPNLPAVLTTGIATRPTFAAWRRCREGQLILPALTEATSPFFRPIKYSLFPPLGLATLAAYLHPHDEVHLVDEHVEKLTLDDDPDLVIAQIYITNTRRAYEIADHYFGTSVWAGLRETDVAGARRVLERHEALLGRFETANGPWGERRACRLGRRQGQHPARPRVP